MDKTCITMVLDRSGSMSNCRQSTIDAVNKYLSEARGSELAVADFELTIFDSLSIDTIRSGKLSEAKDITDADFVPREMTPLYDAMGRGIDGLDNRAGDGKAILAVVTDGMENHSRKHTHSSISELVRARQEKGWLIIFLGAGLDSARQGVAMGINPENVANIGLDEASLRASMEVMASSNREYAQTSNMAEARAYSAAPKFSASERKRMGDQSGGDGLISRASKIFTSSGGKKSASTPGAPRGDSWDGSRDDDAWNSKNQ
jgi:hypothetical protein